MPSFLWIYSIQQLNPQWIHFTVKLVADALNWPTFLDSTVYARKLIIDLLSSSGKIPKLLSSDSGFNLVFKWKRRHNHGIEKVYCCAERLFHFQQTMTVRNICTVTSIFLVLCSKSAIFLCAQISNRYFWGYYFKICCCMLLFVFCYIVSKEFNHSRFDCIWRRRVSASDSHLLYSKYVLFLGYGEEHAGIQCEMYNHHKTASIKIVYFQVFPWHFRIFLHTLRIRINDVIIKPGK
jgi:hypothetical protein